jgi:predicted  nucleic acid-binding Zn-ribbon protein
MDAPRKGLTLNADPADQLRLLDIAEQDARLAQLTHRRRTLPEIAEIVQLTSHAESLRDRIVGAETEASDVAREVAKAETDVEQVRARSGRDAERLESGAITSAKELESLQHEIGSLAKRQSDLEDIELEILERQEDVNRVLTELRQEAADTAERLAAATQRRDDTFAELDKDAGFVTEGRSSLAGSLAPELLALYEKIRAKQNPAAAALRRGQCGACQMQINSTELGGIRAAAADVVLRHEDCGAILVRTAESGL